MEFKVKDCVTADNLEKGAVYLTHSAEIVIYMGKDRNTGAYLFYVMGAVYMFSRRDGSVKLLNAIPLIEGYRVICEKAMHCPFEKDLLKSLVRLCKLWKLDVGEYGYELKRMLALSKLNGVQIPSILSDEEQMSDLTVDTFEKGRIYVSVSKIYYIFMGYANEREVFIECKYKFKDKATLLEWIEKYVGRQLPLKVYKRHKKVFDSKCDFTIDINNDLSASVKGKIDRLMRMQIK